MRSTIIFLALFLLILHQDFWLWGSDSLFLGFLPAGIAYHMAYSVACAVLGGVAVLFVFSRDDNETI